MAGQSAVADNAQAVFAKQNELYDSKMKVSLSYVVSVSVL
jgi:hypothetical protein